MTDFMFIGHATAARPDWQDYYQERPVPGNYSKPETIAKYKVTAAEKQAEVAAYNAVGGTLTHAVVLDQHGAKQFEMVGATIGDGTVAEALAQFLTTYFPDGILEHENIVGCTHPVIGFGLKPMLRTLCCEIMHYNQQNPRDRIVLPYRLWHNPAVLDPYEAIIPGPDRDDVPLGGLCALAGVDYDEAALFDPLRQATLAWRLAEAANLLNYTPDGRADDED